MNEIISKVKDLLSLSSGNINVNESASAYKAAQKLLLKHKLSLADVYAADTTQTREEVTEGVVPLYSGARAITWRGVLAKAICNANGCDCFWNVSNRKKNLIVVGRQSDIDIVTYLFNTVTSQIEALCSVAMMRNCGGGKTFSNNFKLGAVNTVNQRLQEAINETVEEYKGTSALVLVRSDKKEVERAMEKLQLRKTKLVTRYDMHGYSAGKEAGKNINLTRGATKGFLN